MTTEITLYHGTTEESAQAFLEAGWAPGRGLSGGNCGQRRFLYQTNGPENALWYAEEKLSVTHKCCRLRTFALIVATWS